MQGQPDRPSPDLQGYLAVAFLYRGRVGEGGKREEPQSTRNGEEVKEQRGRRHGPKREDARRKIDIPSAHK